MLNAICGNGQETSISKTRITRNDEDSFCVFCLEEGYRSTVNEGGDDGKRTSRR